ncbi:MAG TPA: TonB C-terminal domain-containing protein [Herbaspirillum sp.]|jgi:hypothetical protein
MTHEYHFNRLPMARGPAAAETFVLAGCLVFVMSLSVSLSLSMISGFAFASDAAGLQASSQAIDTAGRGDGAYILFDIPAQPLQNALDAFGAASGFSGLYSVTSTAGRISSPVQGRYSPDAALRMLIGDTGLAVRYTAADAFILEPESADAAPAAAHAGDAYYGALQSQVRGAFCGDSRLARGDYRLAMSFRVDGQGKVRQAALLSSTGDAARDHAVLETLAGIRLEHPPADPSKPFTMLILPGTANCSPIP